MGDQADRVSIPEPRIGDHASYNGTLAGHWSVIRDEEARHRLPEPRDVGEVLAFKWAEGTVVRDGEGMLVATEEVATEGDSYDVGRLNDDHDKDGKADRRAWFNNHDTEVYAQGTHRLVGHRSSTTGYWKYAKDGPLDGAPQVLAMVSEFSENSTSVLFEGTPLCVVDNQAQGRVAAPGDRLVLYPRGCSARGLFAAANWTFVALGWDEVQGRAALRLHAAAPSDVDFATTAMDVWLASGIAYPVRLQAEVAGGTIAEGHGHGDTTFAPLAIGPRNVTLELVGLQAGAQPRAAPTPPQGSVPALVSGARQPWGMDETGVELPFLLSDAYRAAAGDPRLGFREFLATHPKAVMVFGRGLPSLDDGTFTKHGWIFAVGDKQAVFGVLATKDIPNGIPPSLLAGQSATVAFPYSRMAPVTDPLAMDADTAPSTLPTVASLLDRWSRYEEDSRPGNVWIFSLSCPDAACGKPTQLYVAGHYSLRTSGATPDPEGPSLHRESSMTDSVLAYIPGRGAATGFGHGSGSGTHAEQAWGTTSPRGFHSGTLEAVPGTPAVLRVATVGQAVGAGLLGLAAVAVYWLWPTIKASPIFGLFSRVQPEAVLGQRQRRRILRLVATEPGIHFSDLQRRSGLANGVLVHHLRKLVAAEALHEVKRGGYTCYFHIRPSAGATASAAATKAGGARRILDVIRTTPGLTGQQVASKAALQNSTVSYHVKRLVEAGLVEATRDGHAIRLTLAAAG